MFEAFILVCIAFFSLIGFIIGLLHGKKERCITEQEWWNRGYHRGRESAFTDWLKVRNVG